MAQKQTGPKLLLALILFIASFKPAFAGSQCVSPSGNLLITENTTLCNNTYRLGTGSISIAQNGISLDCNGATFWGEEEGYLINIENREGILIKNCIIKNFYNGIHIEKSKNIRLENIAVYSSQNINIEVLDSQNIIIDNCSGFNPGENSSDISYGICYKLKNVQDSSVINSSCQGAQHSGFTYWNAQNSSFINNYSSNTTAGNNIFIIDSIGIEISGNTLSTASDNNLVLTNSSNCSINNNDLKQAGISGIFLDNSSSNTISNNIIQGSKDKPIYKMNSSHNTIRNNTLDQQYWGAKVIGILILLAVPIGIIVYKKKQR